MNFHFLNPIINFIRDRIQLLKKRYEISNSLTVAWKATDILSQLNYLSLEQTKNNLLRGVNSVQCLQLCSRIVSSPLMTREKPYLLPIIAQTTDKARNRVNRRIKCVIVIFAEEVHLYDQWYFSWER